MIGEIVDKSRPGLLAIQIGSCKDSSGEGFGVRREEDTRLISERREDYPESFVPSPVGCLLHLLDCSKQGCEEKRDELTSRETSDPTPTHSNEATKSGRRFCNLDPLPSFLPSFSLSKPFLHRRGRKGEEGRDGLRYVLFARSPNRISEWRSFSFLLFVYRLDNPLDRCITRTRINPSRRSFVEFHTRLFIETGGVEFLDREYHRRLR